MVRYHGGHSPGGAAIAYNVLERGRDAAQEARLTELERALAGRVLACPADEVVELSPC